MKKLLFGTFFVICCINVFALSDEGHNYGLYHCNVTNVTAYHVQVPDDNYSGRPDNPALMEYGSEEPVLVPRAGGGGCLYFDGDNDGLYIPDFSGYLGWPGDKDTFVADFSIKWEDLPPASGDNRAAIIAAGRWYIFLRNNGSDKGVIQVLTYDTDDNATFLSSDATINSDTWTEVHAQLNNGTISLTVGGVTKTTTMSGTLKQGSHPIEIGQGIYAARYYKGYLDEIRYGYIAPYPKKTTARLETINGSPTILVNDKPVVPMMFYGYAENLPSDSNCQFAQQATYSKNAGMHFYTFPINFQGLFNSDESANWGTLDSILTSVTNFDNEAMMIPRFYIYPAAWWMSANPDVHMEWSDGTKDRICIASEKWRAYIKTNIIDFVAHCEYNFGNNVIGYHFTLMDTGEWFYEKSWENLFSGYSENMRVAFANWAQNKYGTETALRNAWNDSSVTFATITLPTTSERASSASAFFRNPATEMKTIDFYDFKNHLVAETIDIMAETIRNVTQSNKLVVTFYGYTFELDAVPKGPAITGHLALKELLKSPYVDIIAGPISYVNRRPGGIGAFMSPVDSIRKAGKMWFNESDIKTYLDTSSDDEINGNYTSLLQTQNAHANNFAHLLVRRMGTWYMDLHDKGWLNNENLWQNISKLHNIYKGQLGEKSEWNPEVAIIVDERSPYYLACTPNLLNPLYYSLRTRLYRMGVPFNVYLLSDVLDGTVTLPKVNIFLGAIYLTTSERSTLHTALSGKAAVWFHGAGYINENGASTANIEDLTGFDMTQVNNISAQINLVSASPWNDGISGATFKPPLFDYGNSSLYETEDQSITYDIVWAVGGPGSAVQLGTYGSSGYTGMAVMDYSGFKSFYCGIAGIHPQFLRNICKTYGVHVYVDDDYVIDSDTEFLSVYSPKSETQQIVLNTNDYLTDFNTGNLDTTVNGVLNQSFSVGDIKTCWIGTNSIGGLTDTTINKGLWHCDNSYLPGGTWLASDDDHSSGRSYVWPLLNSGHQKTHVTAPSLIANSSKGGNCFRFDGEDDNVVAPSGWTDDSNTFAGKVSLKWTDLPPLSDNYDGILISQPWRLYLQNAGSGKGKLLFRVMDSAGTSYTDLQSTVTLNSNQWYDVTFKVYNNVISISVDGNTAVANLNGGMQSVSSDVYAGGDFTTVHYFKGDIDEVMYGAAISGPEPPSSGVTNVFYSELNLADLPVQPRSDDLAQLPTTTKTIVEGGMHSAWGDNQFDYMFNSPAYGNYGTGSYNSVGGTGVLLWDAPSPNTTTIVMHINFAEPETVKEIRVFSLAADARLFNYGEVSYSTNGSAPYTYIGAVSFGNWGDLTATYANSNCVARLYNVENDFLAIDVKSLEITMRGSCDNWSWDFSKKILAGGGAVIDEIDVVGIPEPCYLFFITICSLIAIIRKN